ncbi:MAG: DUF4258 domain-containing protein [Candidatus Kuenenia sp.]|nr:DUF4258 domain-containing protein [Candidatus Kuenenia sp.]
MDFEYTRHAQLKIEERGIQKSEVEEILKRPEEVLLDLETGNLIAVGKRGIVQDRYLIFAYSSEKNKVITITTHLKKKSLIEGRRKEDG